MLFKSVDCKVFIWITVWSHGMYVFDRPYHSALHGTVVGTYIFSKRQQWKIWGGPVLSQGSPSVKCFSELTPKENMTRQALRTLQAQWDMIFEGVIKRNYDGTRLFNGLIMLCRFGDVSICACTTVFVINMARGVWQNYTFFLMMQVQVSCVRLRLWGCAR